VISGGRIYYLKGLTAQTHGFLNEVYGQSRYFRLIFLATQRSE